MDHNTVDNLARLLGSGQSRRRILKTLTGGTLGAIAAAVGLGDADAAVRCRAQGVVCSKNADCCSSTCLPKDRTGRRYCAECGPTAACPTGGQCRTATCRAGVCSNPAKADGTPCDDGNASTCNDVCTNGTCSGTIVNLDTDNSNCGSCGDVCSGTGQTCGGGGTPGVCGCTPQCGAQVCGDDGCGGSCGSCGASGATNPSCEGGVCCEQTVSPGSFCSNTVPCCQLGSPGSRSCNSGSCCVNSGFPTAQDNQCCSGQHVTPISFFCA